MRDDQQIDFDDRPLFDGPAQMLGRALIGSCVTLVVITGLIWWFA